LIQDLNVKGGDFRFGQFWEIHAYCAFYKEPTFGSRNHSDLRIAFIKGFEIKTVSVPAVIQNFYLIDCSGVGRMRKNWKTLYNDIDALIYVIDLLDVHRLGVVDQNL